MYINSPSMRNKPFVKSLRDTNEDPLKFPFSEKSPPGKGGYKDSPLTKKRVQRHRRVLSDVVSRLQVAEASPKQFAETDQYVMTHRHPVQHFLP
jgi:hypothetical protein